MTEKNPTSTIELLTFQLAEQEYSLDIMSVREIRGWARATPGGPYVQDGERAEAARLGIFGEPPDTSGLSSVPTLAAPIFSDQTILAE